MIYIQVCAVFFSRAVYSRQLVQGLDLILVVFTDLGVSYRNSSALKGTFDELDMCGSNWRWREQKV